MLSAREVARRRREAAAASAGGGAPETRSPLSSASSAGSARARGRGRDRGGGGSSNKLDDWSRQRRTERHHHAHLRRLANTEVVHRDRANVQRLLRGTVAEALPFEQQAEWAEATTKVRSRRQRLEDRRLEIQLEQELGFRES